MKRTLVAFLIAPAAAALIFAVYAGVTTAFLFSYLFSYILGVPVFLVLRTIKKENHVCYVAAGFVMGFLYVFIPCLVEWRGLGREMLIAGVMFGCVGFAVAFIFSLLRGHERRIS